MPSRGPPERVKTSFRRSSPQSNRRLPSVKSPTPCAPSLANIKRRTHGEVSSPLRRAPNSPLPRFERHRIQVTASSLLAVDRLTTVFDLAAGPVAAVDDVSVEIRAGETLGLV